MMNTAALGIRSRLMRLTLVAGAVGLVRCDSQGGDLAGPSQQLGDAHLVVSDLITLESLASNASAAEATMSITAADVSVAYVSLVQGSVPRGVTAQITNTRSGFTTASPIINGAVDAVAVPAATGDTVQVIATDSSGTRRDFVDFVKRRVPPVVVRSGAGTGRTDTPLLLVVSISFSEPIAASSVAPSTVRVVLGGQPVDGTLALSPDGLRVDFEPAAPLVPSSTYEIVVSGVRDLGGQSLQEDYHSTFTTEASADTLTFASVSAGGDHTCGATETGAVYCWGANSNGQLGIGDVVNRAVPTRIDSPEAFSYIEADGPRSCGLSTADETMCWGDIGLWAGDASPHIFKHPRPIFTPWSTAANEAYVALTLGSSRICALDAGGEATCIGAYLISSGSWLHIYREAEDPAHAHGLSVMLNGMTFRQIRLGAEHGCGITSSGVTHCWGANPHGELGDGSTQWSIRIPSGDSLIFSAPPVSGGIGFTALSLGGRSGYDSHSCGLADGKVYCWGSNRLGQLGAGTISGSNAPVPVTLEGVATTIAAGVFHTCAITTAGEAYCWGGNSSGQLGDGTLTDRNTPALVAGELKWVSISAGDGHTCGRTVDGLAYCWGRNLAGQLGNGRQLSERTPVKVLLQH
jgi:alpha-tubulin suppressor-like RCC1 family protein